MEKELRKEIIKNLNCARKMDKKLRKLKKETHSMIDTYFSDYKLSKDSSYSDYDVDSAIFDFMENGEYGSNLNEYIDIYGTSSKFMKDLEKFYKENSVNKVEKGD